MTNEELKALQIASIQAALHDACARVARPNDKNTIDQRQARLAEDAAKSEMLSVLTELTTPEFECVVDRASSDVLAGGKLVFCLRRRAN